MRMSYKKGKDVKKKKSNFGMLSVKAGIDKTLIQHKQIDLLVQKWVTEKKLWEEA